MISIITVTFNAASTLEDTLKSIERQTYRNVEIVAVDGGSTDDTVEVFKRHPKYLGTLISEPDKGVYDAMNKGVRAAKGDILFFLNAQDTFYDNYVLEHVAEAFDSAERPYIVFGNVYFTNRQGLPENELTTPPNQVRYYKDAGPNEPGICHQCIFYRKELFDRLGGYDLKYRIFGDFDFNIRAFDFAGDRYKYIPFVIANFDLGGLSTLVNSKYRVQQHQENMELREKYERMKVATRRRKFIFSRGRSLLDGGYFIQLFGVRLDWTSLVRYRNRLPLDLPFVADFKYGVPETLRLKGFENILNGVTLFPSGRADVSFITHARKQAQQLLLKYIFAISIKKAGNIRLDVSFNGKDVDSIDFAGYGEGEWRNLSFTCHLDSSVIVDGVNEIVLSADENGETEFILGLQGISIIEKLSLPVIQPNTPVSFAVSAFENLPVAVRGFYAPEDWGVWLQPKARVEGRLLSVGGAILVKSVWRAFLYPEGEDIKAEVKVNGQLVSPLTFRRDEALPAERSFTIPAGTVKNDGVFIMEIVSLNPVVPAKHQLSSDWRRLGVALCSLEFSSSEGVQ